MERIVIMKKVKLMSLLPVLLATNQLPYVVVPVDPTPIALYTICADKSSTSSGTGEEYFAGHSFIRFESKVGYTIDLGYYSLDPYETVSIGLFGGLSSSSSPSANDGVHYNYEFYRYTRSGVPSSEYYIETTYQIYNLSDIKRFSDVIIDRNNEYSTFSFNCVDFVVESTEAILDTTIDYNFRDITDVWLASLPSRMYKFIEEIGGAKHTFNLQPTNEYYHYTSNGELIVEK